MAFTARQEAILRAVRRDGAVRVAAMAAALRVSQMSVRRDINALVEAGIVDRVHGGAVLASTETGAQPPGAGIPARGRPLCLGMIVPAPSLYFQQLVQGARVAAESLGAQLRIGFSGYDDDEDHALVGRMLDDHLDGLLLTPSSSLKETRPTLDWLAARGIPAVIVERRRGATAAVDCFDYVSSDHEHGTLQALRHLVDGGHRRIALLTRPSTTSHWIRQAFDIATDHYNLPRDVPRVVTVHPQAEAEAGAQVAHVLDAIAESGATAVVAHPDPHAIMLIQQAQLRGRAVPDDLAVVAYDDELAALADIPLTAVAPARQAVGRIAVSRLVQRIRDGSAHVPQHILIPPRLNIRASTGG